MHTMNSNNHKHFYANGYNWQLVYAIGRNEESVKSFVKITHSLHVIIHILVDRIRTSWIDQHVQHVNAWSQK